MGAHDELQRFMTRMLRSRTALTRPEHDADGIGRFIAGNDRLSPAEQLEIYREQFWLRHTACLVEDFPGLGGILGQTDWERLVEEYLVEHVPRSFTLRDLGCHMVEHVKASTWLPHHGLSVDMARLEWEYIELFDAPDAPELDAARVAAVPEAAWETATIVLSPALSLLATDYPVAALRRQLREHPDEAVAIPAPKREHLTLYRGRDRNLKHAALSAGGFALLSALRDGTPLVPACELAAERVPAEAESIAGQVGSWFADWGRLGWVVDVRPASGSG